MAQSTTPGGGWLGGIFKGPILVQRQEMPIGTALYEENRVPDAANCIDVSGKPIFDTTFPAKFAPTEKEMTDREKIAWKTYQLYRLTMKSDRRDTVFEALASSDYPYFRPTQHWMGSPFPVIEPHPFMGEVFTAMRWYEHVLSVITALLYFQWIRAKPQLKYSGTNYFAQKYILYCVFFAQEFNFGYRSIWRLQGQVPNEPECYKYGICETPDRLRMKAVYWAKFKAYKEEWCKRWDYYMWGQRPGERYTLFSACWMAPWPVRFNTKYDYPVRKNPFVLTDKSIRDMRIDALTGYNLVKDGDSYIERCRPEVRYLWRGGVG